MHVGQIPESGLILFTHPSGKIRVIQSLILGGFRHVLQNLQSLINRLSSLNRHLFPFWQDVVSDVRLLPWSQALPRLVVLLNSLFLRRRKILIFLIVLDQLLLILRRPFVKFFGRLWRRVRGRRPIRIATRIAVGTRHGIRPVRAVSLRISPASVWPPPLLRRPRRIVRLLVLRLRRPWLRRSRLGSWRRMLRRRRIRAPVLRQGRWGQHCTEPHRQQTSRKLESKSHQLHRLTFILTLILILILVLIWLGVARIVRLHRLRQVR
jgi:hypothetical protein